MRFADFYRYDGTQLVPVAMNCIQTGTLELTREPVAQRYTLANGAPLTYAADQDTHLRRITLECTPSQADSLAGAVHHGVLVAAGLPSFSHSQSAEYVTPFLNQYRGQVIHITGACTFTEMMRGVIRVELPVQIEDGDVGVPMVGPPFEYSTRWLFLDDNVDRVLSGPYRLLAGGIVARTSAYVTSSDSMKVQCYLDTHGFGELSTATMDVSVDGISAGTATGGNCTVIAQLKQRENIVTVRMYSSLGDALAKNTYIRLPVYRMG